MRSLTPGSFTLVSPGRMELALVFCVRVAVDGDDADRRAGGVRDDDWLGQHNGGSRRGQAAAKYRCGGHCPKYKQQRLFSLHPNKARFYNW